MKKIVVLLIIGLALLMIAESVEADVGPGDRGEEVTEVQYQLASMGYVLPVDGIFGQKTARAVRHFQKANGLLPDAIVGPVTARTLSAAAGATSAATRVSPPAPQVPQFSDLCAEMSWYRQQAGLPEAFDAIGYRESRCQNDAKPTNTIAARYRGWWSVGVMHINNRVYGPGAAACGIRTEADYYGTSPEQKRASACFARVLYDHSGMQPWAL